jgi:hypothetical protein
LNASPGTSGEVCASRIDRLDRKRYQRGNIDDELRFAPTSRLIDEVRVRRAHAIQKQMSSPLGAISVLRDDVRSRSSGPYLIIVTIAVISSGLYLWIARRLRKRDRLCHHIRSVAT